MSDRTYSKAVIFSVSLFAICVELLLTRIMGLKTWSHFVYLVIPFAILGYGIGSNIYLLLKRSVDSYSSTAIFIFGLCCSAFGGIVCSYLLPLLPMDGLNPLQEVVQQNASIQSITILSAACLLMAFPFLGIGFLTAYIFSAAPEQSRAIYFWDLLGAGLGAIVFFPMVSLFGVYYSSLMLAAGLVLLSLGLAALRRPPEGAVKAAIIGMAIISGVSFFVHEPEYKVQDTGIEKIPGNFPVDTYQEVASQWHALGRTDIYRITSPLVQRIFHDRVPLSMSVSLEPLPEFAYIATNFRAGTPVYNLKQEALQSGSLRLVPMKTTMEVPYLLLKNPRVFIIGAGGGRDIIMASANGASGVLGAEVNPFTHEAMSKDGAVYDYSGRVYEWSNVKVKNVDGRHLVKKQPDSSFGFVVLNGVDTFAALSSGSYAFAESYLYTKEAVKDYMRILKDDGVLNVNRWYEAKPAPKESLRLFLIILESLRELGFERPWEHVMIVNHDLYAITIVKKMPFTREEQSLVTGYLGPYNTAPVYYPFDYGVGDRHFIDLAASFTQGKEKKFVDAYPFDISPSTDDRPFFYKSYRLAQFRQDTFHPAGGITVFHTQLLLFVVSAVFILLFICLPLLLAGRRRLALPPRRALAMFVLYFSCLGVGFILIEIAIMQKLTLLLGSPIYSISVTLAALLVFTGLGSLALPDMERRWSWLSRRRLLTLSSVVVAVLLMLFILFGTDILNFAVGWDFWMREVLACLLLLPVGFCLGFFFPTGLALVGKENEGAIPWAWGINCAFTVFGSNLAIIVAQFHGFSLVLGIAAVIYLIGAAAFVKMEKILAA